MFYAWRFILHYSVTFLVNAAFFLDSQISFCFINVCFEISDGQQKSRPEQFTFVFKTTISLVIRLPHFQLPTKHEFSFVFTTTRFVIRRRALRLNFRPISKQFAHSSILCPPSLACWQAIIITIAIIAIIIIITIIVSKQLARSTIQYPPPLACCCQPTIITKSEWKSAPS